MTEETSPAGRVRCHCGSAWVLRQMPVSPAHGETWACYQWVDAQSGRIVAYCPDCGEETSRLSMVPVSDGRVTKAEIAADWLLSLTLPDLLLSLTLPEQADILRAVLNVRSTEGACKMP